MAEQKGRQGLKKELGLLDVYTIATGTTLSAGFFLLPGLAAQGAGPAVVLSYMIAAIPLIPATFSIVELSTAMPRAGGVYYFLDRTMGPLAGTIGGIGTWLALILKVSFALVGMGAYIGLFFPQLPITPMAAALAVIIGITITFGAGKSGVFQIVLVTGLLAILGGFIGVGIPQVNMAHFAGFWQAGSSAILSTAGMVYISYVGVTKIASLSEEVKCPERNLPLGVFLSLLTSLVVYALGVGIMVGVVPMEQLAGNLTPVATAAQVLVGKYGVVLLSIAALLAFTSVANGGTLSASRYPLAMSRDHIMPPFFRRMTKGGSPYYAIAATVGVILLILLLLDPTKIAKLASTFQLLMFALLCLAVIVIRESRIEAYDPTFRSPFYPWMQIAGIGTSFWLILEMGWLPLVFSLSLVLAGFLWYRYYARDRIERTGAIFHVFERLGQKRYAGLETEMRGILKEKGDREEDQIDEIVARSLVIDIMDSAEFEEIVDRVADWLAQFAPHPAHDISRQFMEGTRIGATPVLHDIALPHLRIKDIPQAQMVLVRSRGGVRITFNNPLADHQEEEQTIHALFFLVSPDDNPTQHLRVLARIAGRVEERSFEEEWTHAEGRSALRATLLHEERFAVVTVGENPCTEGMDGHALREIVLPEGCLVAIIHRGEETIVPRGSTVIRTGDRLTIIGDAPAIVAARLVCGL